jgi:phosphoribosylglycinamide formyltransferase 1
MRRVGDNGKLRLGIIGSGKGSNLVSLVEACQSGSLDASIALVLSDVENSGVLTNAAKFSLGLRHIAPGKFRTKLDESAERAFVEALKEAEVDLVVLTGFMRILKGEFLRAFENRVVNIHPSLLPSFPGLEAWKQAFDYGVKVTGCTIHFVDQGIDTGRIIAQRTVETRAADTAASLYARIQAAEHKLYPATIGRIASGEIEIG